VRLQLQQRPRQGRGEVGDRVEGDGDHGRTDPFAPAVPARAGGGKAPTSDAAGGAVAPAFAEGRHLKWYPRPLGRADPGNGRRPDRLSGLQGGCGAGFMEALKLLC